MSKVIEGNVQGLADTVAALRDLAPAIHGLKGFPQNIVRNAARAMANHAKADAQRRVPQPGAVAGDASSTPGYQATGRLKEAIVIKLLSARYRDQAILEGNSREYYFVGVNFGSGREDQSGAWYANMVEVGWDKGEGGSAPAKPFLRPAVYENQAALTSIFANKMRGDMDRVVRRLAARQKPIPNS